MFGRSASRLELRRLLRVSTSELESLEDSLELVFRRRGFAWDFFERRSLRMLTCPDSDIVTSSWSTRTSGGVSVMSEIWTPTFPLRRATPPWAIITTPVSPAYRMWFDASAPPNDHIEDEDDDTLPDDRDPEMLLKLDSSEPATVVPNMLDSRSGVRLDEAL
ncbi:hypothetical protein PR003_g19762 [Phytophthora rubi]|uniref:Uncharacterized protein n=1 Tax=Phytophthora rubi TaxID=129364 RepID=A0A6A4DQ59_9STRA|nr:hypothetical protein PR003_g19762 [Phytophthora rubi]